MIGRIRPTARAAIVCLAYAVLGVGYILLSSSYLVDLRLETVEQATMEQIKGSAFIGVTALLLFVVLRHQFKKAAEAREVLAARAADLARAQQRASVAVVASAIGHDMKNVLSVLRAGSAELEDKLRGDPEFTEVLEDLAEASTRLRAMAVDLMERASHDAEKQRLEKIDLVEVVHECVRMVAIFARGHVCTLFIDAPESCWIQADRKEMEHVALNLIINAIDATDAKGEVQISVMHEDGRVVLRVADDGPGVPLDLRERIFEPFFTTKGEKGSGVGLAVTRDIVRQYQGEVRVRDSEQSGGALFEVVVSARSGPPPASEQGGLERRA